MEIYVPDRAVAVTMPFLDYDGKPVTPASLLYTILDESGAEILAETPIVGFVASLGSHKITVTAAQNAIGVLVRALRKVRMKITDADTNEYWVESVYILETSGSLVAAENSFQTMDEALLNARDIADIEAWNASTDEQRRSAMINAFDQMSGFSLRLRWGDHTTAGASLSSVTGLVTYGTTKDLTADEYGDLDPIQLSDLKKAQIAQADFLLGGNDIEKAIADGLQSSTIGEVSQFFRPRPSLSLSISRKALQYMGRYIVWSKPITRS